MLSKKESKVMQTVYELTHEKKSILISPIDVLKILGEGYNAEELDKIMCALNMDGYFDLVYSDRHGEQVYCIALSEKGKSYKRSVKVQKRNIIFRICFSACLALFSFVIGLILKAIFK